mgnify:CR=1 FL=1|jgi:hypothetical protein
MIWTLIGTLMVGVLAASLTFIGFRLVRAEPPRWLLPAAAGLAMLIFHIASDYAWFGRTTAAFPEHLEVGETYTKRSILQPWTLIAAPVERFSAVDTQALRRNPAVPDLVMAEIHLLQRYYPTVTLTQLYDCSEPRRAAVGADLAVDADGRPTNADWEEIAADDPVRRVVCGASTSTLDQRSTRNRGISDAIREREQWLSTAFSSSTTSRASGST